MKHHYISLGAACDVGMVMDELALRKTSLPFDWLWNLDSGLEAVTHMIATDFALVSDRQSYEIQDHYRLTSPSVVYRSYPSIIHMHSNPMDFDDAHLALQRRMQRFRDVLASGDTLHFVYYKNYNEELLKSTGVSILDTFSRMMREGGDFLSLITSKTSGKVSLLLVLQTDAQDSEDAQKIVASTSVGDRRVSLGHTISRYDYAPELNAIWRHQWFTLLLRKTRMPLSMRFSLSLKMVRTKLARSRA